MTVAEAAAEKKVTVAEAAAEKKVAVAEAAAEKKVAEAEDTVRSRLVGVICLLGCIIDSICSCSWLHHKSFNSSPRTPTTLLSKLLCTHRLDSRQSIHS